MYIIRLPHYYITLFYIFVEYTYVLKKLLGVLKIFLKNYSKLLILNTLTL